MTASRTFPLVFWTLAVVSLGVSALRAQGVWPRGYASVVGGRASATPFSISKALSPQRTRMVLAIAGSSLPFGKGTKLRGIGFRRDGIVQADYTAYAGSIRVRIRTIADARQVTASVALFFDASHEVYRGPVAVPAAPKPRGSQPANFDLRITFAQPWEYTGGDLVLECNVEGPAGAVWRCDTVDLGHEVGGTSSVLGPGCATSTTAVPTLAVEDLRGVRPGGTVKLVQERLPLPPIGAAGLFVIGQASPPVALGPAFPPGCDLYVLPILPIQAGTFGDRASTYARSTLKLSTVSDRQLVGARFAVQGLAIDTGLTSKVPIALTNALELEFGPIASSIALGFTGRAFWVYGSQPTGRTEGARSGPKNRVVVVEFF